LSLEVVPGPGSLRILREKVAMLIESEGEREKRGLLLVPWFAAQELLPNVDWGQSGGV
jgi:hypothetical protein